MLSVLATVLLALILAWLASVDLRTHRLPDSGTLPLIGVGLALGFSRDGLPGLADSALGAAIGFVSLWAVAVLYHRLRGVHGLGLGDAKLLAAAGAWLGPWLLAPTVFIGAVLALVAVAILHMTGRPISSQTRIAFGPFLSAGFFLLWCLYVESFI